MAETLTSEEMLKVVKETDLIALREKLKIVDPDWAVNLADFIKFNTSIEKKIRDTYNRTKLYNIIHGNITGPRFVYIFIVYALKFIQKKEETISAKMQAGGYDLQEIKELVAEP